LHVLRRYALAEGDVGFRDEDVDGIDLGGGDGSRRRRFLAGSSGEQRCDATGGNCYYENDKTRGFHTLHFPQ
jgi:hypothetical protein